MTLKTTKDQFEKALQIAIQDADPYRASIAAGLIDLATAVQTRTTQIKTDLDAIKRKVN